MVSQRRGDRKPDDPPTLAVRTRLEAADAALLSAIRRDWAGPSELWDLGCQQIWKTELERRDRDRNALIRSIRQSPIAAIVTEPTAPDNPIIAANHAFEQLTGYRETELIGHNCRILSGPDTEPAGSSALRHAVATASPTIVELTNYRKDGTRFRNAVMIAPVLDAEGKPAFFVGSQMEVIADQRELPRASAAARLEALTSQQQAVLRLMARGLRNRQIAEAMRLTEKTIKMHRGALVRRLGVATSAEAIRLAIEAGC